MWLIYAFGSAVFAGITSILAKCGIRRTNSNVATAVRTIIVLAFAWIMVFISGTYKNVENISIHTYIFLIMSGIATGASWLCYFRALQLGDINKVVPIDKSSTVLSIILAMIFFHEFENLPAKILGIILISFGTYLMIEKKSIDKTPKKSDDTKWFAYALLSAVFASLTSILGKIGIKDIDSNLGTAIRTSVVLIMAWIVVFITGKQKEIKLISKKELFFISLSGLATGASWLCYYRALQDGPASIVVPIDKLSILMTVAFSYIVFKEKLTKKSFLGLLLISAGTLAMVILR